MTDLVALLDVERGAHLTPNARGWVTLDCPWCGKPYLGWSTSSGVFFCFNCRSHPFAETLARVLGCSEESAMALATRYPSKTVRNRPQRVMTLPGDEVPDLRFPDLCGALTGTQERYLMRRGFTDVEGLVKTWLLQGIGPAGGNLANRIIIPVVFGGRCVSWTARSIQADAPVRYLSCPAIQEVLPVKSVVFGWQHVTDAAVVVEGPFDAMKVGPGTVATMGTAWTQSQLKLLSGLRRVVVLFDSEPKAQRNAHALAESLAGLGVETEVATLDAGTKDPGDMSERDAEALRRGLIGR